MGSIDDLYRSADAVALAGHVRAGEVSAAELTEAALRAIETLNPRLNAVIHRLDAGAGGDGCVRAAGGCALSVEGACL
jgi:Asp-tRNA(Asn)/Glu-tRNA(Gln) amidotransferase A subunit family amidase